MKASSAYSTFSGDEIYHEDNRSDHSNTNFWKRVKSLSYSTAIVTVSTFFIFLGSVLLISSPTRMYTSSTSSFKKSTSTREQFFFIKTSWL